MKQKIWMNDELEQGSPEWLEFRSRGLGGSEVACLMGMSPWGSVEELWEIKTGARVKEFSEDQMAVIDRGTHYEEEARQWYQSVTKSKIDQLCAIHQEIEWMRTSLDGVNTEKTIVQEFKVPSSLASHKKQMSKALTALKRGKQNEPGNYVPEWRYPQLQHQLEVMSSHFPMCKKAHYVSYSPEAPDKSVIIEVTYNKPFVSALVSRENIFMMQFYSGRFFPEVFNWGTKEEEDDMIIKQSGWFLTPYGIPETQRVIDWKKEF